eukprot:3623983-Prymnesium_polylepis.1
MCIRDRSQPVHPACAWCLSLVDAITVGLGLAGPRACRPADCLPVVCADLIMALAKSLWQGERLERGTEGRDRMGSG